MEVSDIATDIPEETRLHHIIYYSAFDFNSFQKKKEKARKIKNRLR